MATPSIRKDDAILTAYASIIINASAEEVFGTISSSEEYGSGYFQYKWDDNQPIVGARGIYSFRVEEIQDRNVPAMLTLLDPVHKKMAAKTVRYPDWLLGSERVQEVVSIRGKANICEYRTWITLAGIGAYYPLLTAKEELEDGATDAAMELKVFVEKRNRKG
ncbi:hypothetical protein SBOR_7432 [Sclerotinia borealis F-4128]|uniref:Uncharacterized protein n=1 Tax=Sclerotinia borealis (strain F-4128) TaxID=1432307 RepID=W9CC83_SCLBF|nr:hypothetical protein SBOR_7432 [Sclerotinia borealis F-4128]